MADAITDMWRSVLLFVPKAVAFIAILVVGYFVAKGVRKVVDKILERVGFDRAVERGGIGRALERTRYDASDILAKLVYYAVLLLTLQLAFGVWGPNPVSDLISGVVAWLPRAFVAIVIVVVSAAIAGAVRDLIRAALGGLTYGRFVAGFAWAFIVGLGVIAALNQAGIATTVTTPVLVAVLATSAGILIVGVGGGLVRPMQSRWDTWLTRAATETEVIRERAREYAAEVQARDEAERAARAEAERLEAERKARLEAEENERIDAERRAEERRESERIAAQQAEAEERLARERAEALERAEAEERAARERAEAEAEERAARERAAAEEAGRDDANRQMSDKTAVIPRQEDPATPAPDVDATQAINTGRGLYQSGSVAPSGKLAPLASDGSATGPSYRPGRAGGEPTGADPTQPVPPPDAVRRDRD
ncbi:MULTISPECIES: mechanosensitive ion channel family protein [Catenuloplanes]|uniref:Flagellar biosynthesis GTPase FlhF n=1 Tax=Catenuloplanes niger TaxID=587534 RepID=A0AAE3ZTP1_9ACTN|nr:hypothetical protein [Catenuloplanes niger]MDR7325672.1 flagellar biosynthesis GTPase FlhF [Catenuloplanes niger]